MIFANYVQGRWCVSLGVGPRGIILGLPYKGALSPRQLRWATDFGWTNTAAGEPWKVKVQGEMRNPTLVQLLTASLGEE